MRMARTVGGKSRQGVSIETKIRGRQQSLVCNGAECVEWDANRRIAMGVAT